MRVARRRPPFWRSSGGATAVEFALVIGPLLLLLVGTIEVGRLMWSGHALDEVAISTARCMGIYAPSCAIDEEIRPDLVTAYVANAALSWGIVVASDAINLSTSAGCAVETGFLRVALSMRFDSVLPGLSGMQLNAEACFPSQF